MAKEERPILEGPHLQSSDMTSTFNLSHQELKAASQCVQLCMRMQASLVLYQMITLHQFNTI